MNTIEKQVFHALGIVKATEESATQNHRRLTRCMSIALRLGNSYLKDRTSSGGD